MNEMTKKEKLQTLEKALELVEKIESLAYRADRLLKQAGYRFIGDQMENAIMDLGSELDEEITDFGTGMIKTIVHETLKRAAGVMHTAMDHTADKFNSETEMEFVDAMVRVMEMVDQLARGTNPFEQNMN